MTISRATPIAELPQLLRPAEAAALLDCSTGLVYEMCRRGDLAAVRLGRLVRIPKSAIAVMVAAQNTGGGK